MAVIHRTALKPAKLELLASCLRSRPWHSGGAGGPELAKAARGWALWKALACLLIGHAGAHGRPGGKATWGPPAAAALRRLTATRP